MGDAEVNPTAVDAAAPLPGPRGNWLLGSTEVLGDALGSFARWHAAYGDMYRFRVGLFRVVQVSHPSMVEEVFFTKARSFKKGTFEHAIDVAVPKGLLLSEGDFWKRQRRLMSPPFHHRAIASYGDIMVECADRVSADWRAQGPLAEGRDVFPDTTRIAAAVVARSLFDADVERDAAGLGRAINAFMGGLRLRIESLLPMPFWLPTPANVRLKRSVREISRLIDRFIAGHRAKAAAALQAGAPDDSDTSRDLLSLLLAARDEDGRGMPDQQIREEVLTLFVAGFETTSVALAAALYFLAVHPQMQDRLRAEVTRAVGDRPPTAADLPALGYVDAIAKETMRLFPPAYSIDRDVIEPVQIGGRQLQPGTIVVVVPHAMHRDPRYWVDPERFDPDRWSTPAVKALPRGVYFPFGLGPRICIGASFATMEMVLVLARLCQRFHFAPIPGAPLEADPGFTLRPKQARLRITPLADQPAAKSM